MGFFQRFFDEAKREVVNLLTSKKFMASVGTAAFAVVSRTRFRDSIDPGTVDRVIGLMAAYVLAQMGADWGSTAGTAKPAAGA